jgi:hypothetical protein
MSKINQYPLVTPVAGDKVIITQVNGNPQDATKNVTLESIAALSQSIGVGYTVMNGLIANLGSQTASPVGYDYMEWTSNVTPDSQIPLIRTLRKYKLMQVGYVYTGDQPLTFSNVGDSVRFDIGRVNDGDSATVANWTAINTSGALFGLDNNNSGTYPSGQVDLANENIIIPQFTNIGVIGQESGSVTPVDGELAISFLFEETV